MMVKQHFILVNLKDMTKIMERIYEMATLVGEQKCLLLINL